MIYKKNNLELSAITGSYPSEVECVFFKKNGTVATDRYKLVEISTPEGEVSGAMRGVEPFMVNGRELAKMPVSKDELLGVKHLNDRSVEFIRQDGTTITLDRQAGTYPDFETAFRQSAGNRTEITVDVDHLMDLLKMVKKVDTKVKLRIGKSDDPIMATAKGNGQTLRGLLMPIKE